ncbi:sigma-70 family RNA polymerase sigma factor, partial [Candidatus Sumerlaeota bacterium]|nr:sigma-70 family RNA polymerase sigma factor [Candidatus Sumerlaeota bacterium]
LRIETTVRTETPDPRSDAALVKAVRGGDGGAMDALVERHFRVVFMIAVSRLGNREAAEDLSQEVFLRALLALEKLRDPERFAAWLCQITRNLAQTWRTRGQSASRLVQMVPLDEIPGEIRDTQSQGAREAMETQEREQAVHEALSHLPEEERDLVLLHFAEGMSQRDIAGRLGVNQATISRRLARALRAMEVTLESEFRESLSRLRTPRTATVRTMGLMAAVLALPPAAKASLAVAAGFTGSAGSVIEAGQAVGILSTIAAAFAAGGKIMATGKGFTATIAAAAALVGGLYLRGEAEGAGQAPMMRADSPAAEVLTASARRAPTARTSTSSPLVTLPSAPSASGGAELLGPEPGVFIYRLREDTDGVRRIYCPTQQAAVEALQPDMELALTAARELNAQIQGNLTENTLQTTAEWMIFAEQWHLWQDWVLAEYGFDEMPSNWPRFEAVPGTTLRWETPPEPTPTATPRMAGRGTPAFAMAGPGAPGVAMARGEGDGMASYASAGGGRVAAGMAPAAPADTRPEPVLTLASLANVAGGDGERQLATEAVGEAVRGMVQDRTALQHAVLSALLEQAEEARQDQERRQAAIAAGQREINDLGPRTLEIQAADTLMIDGTLYVFSDHPLEDLPEGAVNISTPNLTPYDIFEEDGAVRSTP